MGRSDQVFYYLQRLDKVKVKEVPNPWVVFQKLIESIGQDASQGVDPALKCEVAKRARKVCP